ncbi:cytosolic sulfotransferase 15-like isoform X1 [Euphorbia lathyris]|uniref:cytosolic sulfotransferase 15-like isoform X1 n=1 Tax=Euphorbia lathyris TaxID=212925 RepID=UPI003313E8BA
MEQDKTFSSSKLVLDVEQQIKELLPSLPKTLEGTITEMAFYEGFWCFSNLSGAVISFQRCFQAQDTDLIIASNPKSGTTWLKALMFSIVNRTRYTPSNTPLLTSNPHDLVPFLDAHLYAENQVPDLTIFPSPRLFSTHLPCSGLPESVKQSKCPIVYICRNPFDSAVSLWHHYHEMGLYNNGEMSMEDFFDVYFEGVSWYGPYWDHVLGYWKESLEKPNKVLFLKYEDMKKDIVSCLKRIAEFIGYPFSREEDRDGVIEEIVKLCSLSNLKNLEVNIEGMYLGKVPNKSYFRKGKVGEWVDYLSPSKKKHLENVMQEKLRGSGLSFKLSI